MPVRGGTQSDYRILVSRGNTLLNEVYDRARFDLAVDYTQPSVPPLKDDDAAWAEVLLRKRGLRE